ncbi:PREDICTED: uncharacterized protein LOC101304556 [Fragaria vesca subsp. vesca]|uniref:uncharacterized protein LOC101304556 n=1 Tax=Fragaria vesca subsp. vesca TaxID=101020 RepID=UPI0002C2DF71|nr:PREDICTED: uncharacterized protein LOC101304556 [Fragaria vesca subsp. vesca]
MASACVNNIGMSPEKFSPATTYPSYGWLSPRVSFSCDNNNGDNGRVPGTNKPSSPGKNQPESSDPELSGGEFEFRLEDPVAMLPADELFSGGKLMPLHISSVKPPVNEPSNSSEIRLPETVQFRRRPEAMSASLSDPYLFSPKAPRCSSRWRELLGLKKLYLNSSNGNGNGNGAKAEVSQKTTSSSAAPKSLKHFLHRSSKSLSSSIDASLSLPLLRDSDCESVSISSRLSLSSSSSGHEHDDLPRLSLDSDKPNPHPNQMFSLHRKPTRAKTAVKIREIKQRAAADQAARVGRSPMRRPAAAETSATAVATSRGVSVDSPRMNSSGKIVFQSLERSSSSPSSFNGGPRLKHRGMERSYSANVRVTPVLNVPVCSLRGSSKTGFGFGQLFSSPQKRDSNGAVFGKGVQQHSHYVQQSQSHNNRNRADRN